MVLVRLLQLTTQSCRCSLGTEFIGQSEYLTDRGVITHNLIRCFTSKIPINYSKPTYLTTWLAAHKNYVPAFSSLAFSTPAVLVPRFPISRFPPPAVRCRIFHSRVFHSRVFSAPNVYLYVLGIPVCIVYTWVMQTLCVLCIPVLWPLAGLQPRLPWRAVDAQASVHLFCNNK